MNFTDLYYNIVDYFSSQSFRYFLLWAKIISYSISTLLIIVIAILLTRSKATWWVSERVDSFRKAKLPEIMEKDWQKIQKRMEKDDEANLKLAVIEADNMLNSVLKRMGLEGKDMGERLEKLTPQQLTALEEVWDAHRLRNLIVHQSTISVHKQQAERAVKAYETALKELEVI